MSNTLYLECGSGISGDMTVGALLDLGAREQVLREALDSLPVEGFRIEIGRVKKSGLDACDFRVILDQRHENHDHDMEYLHGHMHEHGESGMHTHDGTQTHGHSHGHENTEDQEHHHGHAGDGAHSHPHAHEHRGLPEIFAILRQGKMTNRAREIAVRIFTIIGEAEAKAHGVPMDQVHFHEVGAVDSIVDIVAVAVCVDDLDIQDVIIPELSEGSGFVRCQHGVIPVPVPAVLNIVQAHGLTLHMTGIEGELVTPTGAAIAAALRTKDRLPKRLRCVKTGIGAGKRNYERPSLLRAMLIEADEKDSDRIWKLESNIDDCTGEALGYVMDRLMAAGARDVHYTPVYMKKNRPAYQLNVICTEDMREELEAIIFAETTTIGIRRVQMERTTLQRSAMTAETVYGEAKVKVCTFNGIRRCYPEYSSVVEICKKSGLGFGEAYQLICQAAYGDKK